MTRSQVDRFFRTLAREMQDRVTVILTGAAVAALLGRARASRDVDFAIRPLRRDRSRSWEAIQSAVERTVRITGITADYAEDIDRWGPISLMGYRRHTRPYRRFGKVEVRLLEPAYWSIGKMSRCLVPDVRDMVGVFRRIKLPWREAVAVWARALRASPPSTARFQFRRQVEDFLRKYGRAAWGKGFDADEAMRSFRRAAGIR